MSSTIKQAIAHDPLLSRSLIVLSHYYLYSESTIFKNIFSAFANPLQSASLGFEGKASSLMIS